MMQSSPLADQLEAPQKSKILEATEKCKHAGGAFPLIFRLLSYSTLITTGTA